MHSDNVKRDNKGTKEFHKFKLCFDIVDSLPSEFDKITEDLLLSITKYVYEPTKSFEEWTQEACTNACSKGHTVLYKEKIVPQLTQGKTYRNNTTSVITEESRKEFYDLWKQQVVNEIEDNARKEEILKVVEPMIVKDSQQVVIEIPEVQKIIGKARVCWSCFSEICSTRRMLAMSHLKKKAVNKGCPNRKMTLGDTDLFPNFSF
jgi:hypothetical protein